MALNWKLERKAQRRVQRGHIEHNCFNNTMVLYNISLPVNVLCLRLVFVECFLPYNITKR